MKYVHLENNKILGWYSDGIHDIIPTPNIEVSDEVWQEALSINANCYENGKFIVKDFRTEDEITEQAIQAKVNEAKQYLASTDYKMTVDYFATLTEVEQNEIMVKRAEAREFIRANEQ